MSKFIHLHVHSHYSLLSALPKIKELVETAKKMGMPALALTDNGNLYGAIEFYKECEKAELKPIIGVDFYMAVRGRLDKEPGVDNRRHRLVLLAKNNEGYKNLLKLVTFSYLEGFYYKPRVDWELLEKYGEGLIAILPFWASPVSAALRSHDGEEAEKILDRFKKIFPDTYLEITGQDKAEGYDNLRKDIVALSGRAGVPLSASNDVYYLLPEDKEARETLLSVQSGGERERWNAGEEMDFSMIGGKRAEEIFGDIPEALQNTLKISETCEWKMELGKFVFPNFPIPEGETADGILEKLAMAGLGEKGLSGDIPSLERLSYELGIIKMKNYASYFLVVEDLIRYARSHEIYYNIRGSVAGSMTTYVLNITKLNPLEYKIPFERFLNPERPSAPDIDMDFADNRRDEIIEYAKQKYGESRVAQVGTFGTMMARGSVRDTARALGFPYALGDRISKLIPFGSQGFPMYIDKALESVPELREIYEKEEDARRIIDMAKKIEGCARHISVHAAGVVIAPAPLINYTPLQYDPKGESLITQYDMYSVGDDGGVGLTKFDFLGLKNLAILSDAVRLVKKINGKKINIEDIPLDDKKTFEMLSRGETEGLFQLNGGGMTKWLKELRPSSIHDINAMVALYRPGPMQFIPDYIGRKHNRRLIKYADPVLEPILEQTYGVLVYQDDLLIMAHDLAGYSWGEVDKFRKAVGKKIPAEMAAQKEKFIKGCVEHSKWPKKKAEEIWAWIEPFAAYGFNKAHSASYGRVAYQTSYMKANYPVIYMCACLTADSGDVDKISIFLAECRRMGIPVLPPDINESFGAFTVVKGDGVGADKIRFGLFSIKNFGEGIGGVIIEERKKSGKYKSLPDFLERIRDRNLNKKSLESLIKCGAMDALGERGEMLANIEELLSYNKETGKQPDSQNSLFGGISGGTPSPFHLNPSPQADGKDKLAWEKELLGLYVSGHPLDRFKEKLENRESNIRFIKEKMKEGMMAVVAGLVEEAKEITTKGGEKMAFLKLSDYTGTIEAVIFPKLFAELRGVIAPEKCLVIKGRLSMRGGAPSIVAEAAREMA